MNDGIEFHDAEDGAEGADALVVCPRCAGSGCAHCAQGVIAIWKGRIAAHAAAADEYAGRGAGSMEHRRFTNSDWAIFLGAAKFADGSEPFITDRLTAHIGREDLDVFAVGDPSGVYLFMYSKTQPFVFMKYACWAMPLPNSSAHLISTILAGLPSTLTENDLHAYRRLSAAEVKLLDETRHAEVQAPQAEPQSESAEMNDLKAQYETLLRDAEALQARAAYLRSRMEALGISAPAGAPVEAAGGLGRTLLAVLAGIGGWGVGLALARRANPDPGAAIRNYSPDWPEKWRK